MEILKYLDALPVEEPANPDEATVEDYEQALVELGVNSDGD